MARRQLLTDEQWARLLAPPSDEREIVRYWTLSREDFDIIFRKRSERWSGMEGGRAWRGRVYTKDKETSIQPND